MLQCADQAQEINLKMIVTIGVYIYNTEADVFRFFRVCVTLKVKLSAMMLADTVIVDTVTVTL